MELSERISISEFLEELTKTSQDAITITDLDGRVLSCNAVAECLYGCSADDMTGRYFASLWANISADDLRTRANKLACGVAADEFYGELRAETRPCERSSVHVRVSLIRDVVSAMPRVVYSATCFGRKSGPRLGIRACEKEDDLASALPILLCARLDAALRFLDANSACERWVGGAPGTLLGRTFAEVVGDLAYESWRPFLSRALDGHRVCAEVTLFHHTGSGVQFTLHLVPATEAEADAAGCWLVACGKPESGQTQNGQLQFEQGMRETLVREVHHRVKNSLQGIVGMLRADAVSQPQLTAIIDPVIAQLRAVAVGFGLTSKRGKSQLVLCELVQELVRNIMDVTNTPIDVVLSEQVSRHPVAIRSADAVNLSLVINELIFNAVKHSPTPRPAHGVRVVVDRDAGSATFSVRNPGGRLPASFDLASGAGLGTGLNLVLCLLPPGSTSLQITDGDDGVTAELKLNPPTVRTNILELNSALRG